MSNIAEKLVTVAEKIPKVYETGYSSGYSAGQSSMVDESKLIPKTVSGSYISVDDVSEIPHSVGCKVESVNLCPEVVYSGYYFDSVPNASRAHSKYIRIAPFTVEPSTTYTFSSNLMLYTIWFCNANGEGISKLSWEKVYTRTFTTPENCTELRITIINTSGTEDTTAFEYAILNLGTEALSHIPYVSPKSVRVTRTEANIIPYPWEHSTLTHNGVSFTDNRDGTLTINGTSTGAFPYILLLDKDIVIGGTLVYSNNANKPLSNITMCVVRKDYNDMIMWKSNESGTPKTLENFTVKAILLQIDKGAVFDNVTIKPILGTGQILIPNADGTIEGMTSVSPYMNIFTDTEGVNIEAKYNKSYGIQIERERFYNDFKQGKINVSISFEWLILDKASTTSVINALSITATGQKLTLNLAGVNKAFETASGKADGSTSTEFAALVGKRTNWTIALK